MQPKILVVEDDTETLSLVSAQLRIHGPFEVVEAASLTAMDKAMAEHEFDLIVLDVNLPPEGNGVDKCKELRAKGVKTPIILATAASELVDKVLGLEHADDHLSKPYSSRELTARIKAILRRLQAAAEGAVTPDHNAVYVFEGFAMDTAARTVTRTDTNVQVTFTSAEFDVLQCFMKMPNQPISRPQIVKMTHGRENNDPFDRSVDVLVSRIRKHLSTAGARDDLFKTIRNGGYQITAKVEKRAAGY